jgi:ABC-2 type transport system permease protein
MKGYLHKAAAFIVRDFQIESGYKLNFIMRACESMIILVLFYFLGELISGRSSPGIAKYSDHYLPFAIIGLGFARYFDLTLRMFSESIRLAQVTGCLEAMLSSQTGCLPIVLMSSLYGLISGAVQLMIILAAGTLAFGVDFGKIDVPATLLVFALSVLIFVAFGVVSAATILWLKKGDPITWILSGFGAILGGAYFPLEVMPDWMRHVSQVIPLTYALDALRLTMLKGYSIPMVAAPIVTLSAMTAVLLPLSLVAFAAAVRRGRKEGTLMHY